MKTIATKYGLLNDASVASYYSTGEIESYSVDEESILDILGYKFTPLYGFF